MVLCGAGNKRKCGSFVQTGKKMRRTLLHRPPVRPAASAHFFARFCSIVKDTPCPFAQAAGEKNVPARFFKRFCSMDKSCAAHRSNRTRRFCAERETKESAAVLCGGGNKRKRGRFCAERATKESAAVLCIWGNARRAGFQSVPRQNRAQSALVQMQPRFVPYDVRFGRFMMVCTVKLPTA